MWSPTPSACQTKWRFFWRLPGGGSAQRDRARDRLGRRPGRREAVHARRIAAPALAEHALEHPRGHLRGRAPEARGLDDDGRDRDARRLGGGDADEPLVAPIGVLAREASRLARNGDGAEQRLPIALAE